MATYLYTLEGLPLGATDFVAHRFNNDTGIWSDVTAPPTITPGMSGNYNHRLMGGWDGSYWYVILPDGMLYRYKPSTDLWSGPLASGAVIIPGVVGLTAWGMASDGRFVYIYSAGGFRRYDPASDTLALLNDEAPGVLGDRLLIIYDGDDRLYIYRGDPDTAEWGVYTISTASWFETDGMPANAVAPEPLYGAFLQGQLWVLRVFTQTSSQAFSYSPSGDAWSSHSTFLPANGISALSPFGEINDSTLRIWSDVVPGAGTYVAVDYNITDDSWTAGPTSTWNTRQGGNWAVSRAFLPPFIWYLSDETTLAPAVEDLGQIELGDTVYFHFTVQSRAACPAGAFVSVPVLPLTDAEDAATISSTSGGVFATGFTTAALSANEFFDVWVKVAPVISQTFGMSKSFDLQVEAVPVTEEPEPLMMFRFEDSPGLYIDEGTKGYDLANEDISEG